MSEGRSIECVTGASNCLTVEIANQVMGYEMNVRRVVSEQISRPTDNDLKINLRLTWDHQPGEAYSLYRP